LAINSEIKTSERVIQGIILERPVKTTISGYPFRSVFYIPTMKKVFAEMTEDEVMLVSQRKKAIEKLLPIIKKYLY